MNLGIDYLKGKHSERLGTYVHLPVFLSSCKDDQQPQAKVQWNNLNFAQF